MRSLPLRRVITPFSHWQLRMHTLRQLVQMFACAWAEVEAKGLLDRVVSWDHSKLGLTGR